jgi:hypothetical protein
MSNQEVKCPVALAVKALFRLSPEEIYGPEIDAELYAVPRCAVCHEQEVLKAGDVCSACAGGEN